MTAAPPPSAASPPSGDGPPAAAASSVGAWRHVRDDVLRFDRDGVRLRNGLRMAIGTVIALAVGYAAGSWAAGAAAAGGALSVGISSVVPAPRPRVAILTATAAAMALGAFIGSATSAYAGPHVVAVAAFTFGCGLLVAVEPAATSVGLNAVVGLVVYGRFPASPQTALQSAGLVAAGGLLQVVLAVVVHGRTQVSRALLGLSGAYAAVASYAADLDVERSSLPIAAAIDTAITDREFSFATGAAGEACTSLSGEARRIRLELLSLAGARLAARQADHPDAALLASFDRLAPCLAAFFDHVVNGLAHAQVPASLDHALVNAAAAIEELRRAAGSPQGGPVHQGGPAPQFTGARARTAAAALGGQLRAVAALLPEAVDLHAPRSAVVRSAGRVSRRGARGARVVVQRMWANLTWHSDAFLHAVRLAVVVSVAAALAHAVGIGRGYWLALTAVLVLRPEFSATFNRGVGRALGTFVGVGVATTIALATRPHGWVLVVFVGAFVWLSGALFNASYTVFSVAVTGAVVFLLAGIDPDPVTTARDRLIATVLGSAVALGLYAIWPAWGRRRVADDLADLADATRRYVELVLRAAIDPLADGSGTPAAGRAVRLARTNTESSIDRSLGDPASRRIDHTLTLELLAGFRRLAIAGHTLRLSPRERDPRERDTVPATLPELAAALDAELNAIAARLRFGRITVVRQPLRAIHRELADRAGGSATLLVAETDEMVDAANSLADILDRAPIGVT